MDSDRNIAWSAHFWISLLTAALLVHGPRLLELLDEGPLGRGQIGHGVDIGSDGS
jgi:hypothetical protein